MVKITINGNEYQTDPGISIIEACDQLNIEIPRFCYHKSLEIAGNCRMCLVEVEKSPKPVPSCVQVVTEGMVIHTDSPIVKKAREGVMEFLLINHPLDCPICDQGGECDLQEQALHYGKGKSSYREEKRAVTDKYMGPLIATHMNRCIHCTRCIRFLEDVAGTPELGGVGRGEHMEVTNYIEQSLSSELSGNIIDLCPVGALTSKPYSFKARSWELDHTYSIDVSDAVGSHIRIDSCKGEVMRILPSECDDINGEWISDKARFSYDALKYQRLTQPILKVVNKEDHSSRLEIVSWDSAFKQIKKQVDKIQTVDIGAIAGDYTDVETMFMMQELLHSLNSYNHDFQRSNLVFAETIGDANSHNQSRGEYIFNSTISGIEKSDSCLLIGCNPRREAPILNIRIRQAVTNNGMTVGVLGQKEDLNYPFKHIGNNKWLLKQIASGEHPYCSILAAAKYPILIIGESCIDDPDAKAIIYYAKMIAQKFNMVRDDWNGYNVLHSAAARVGSLDIGFVPDIKNKFSKSTQNILEETKVLFLLGADEINFSAIPASTFVIYIGHHGDRAAARADLILPGAAYTEKNSTYVNLEGRIQKTSCAVKSPGNAIEDWVVIRDIARYLLEKELNYKNIGDIRDGMAKRNRLFAQGNDNKIHTAKPNLNIGRVLDFAGDKFTSLIANYYHSDVISRNSRTMNLCSKEIS